MNAISYQLPFFKVMFMELHWKKWKKERQIIKKKV